MPGYVTDRPNPENVQDVPANVTIEEDPAEINFSEPQPGPSSRRSPSNTPPPPTPENIRPLPKAAPEKLKSTSRKRRVTAILTDTPIKDTLEEEQKNKRKKTIVEPKKKE
ncbi:hypothetical protein Zmor_014893 [Zophobas morio]|nr:hypothetical protein Zmor_014893 [Zophobas morio]